MTRQVHSIPKADSGFHQAAVAALDGIDPRTAIDDVAAAIADQLRPTYPAIVVHRQAVEARMLDIEVWYAYRDGPFGGTAAT